MKLTYHSQQLANTRREFLEAIEAQNLDNAIEQLEDGPEELPENLFQLSVETGWRLQLIWLLEKRLNGKRN